MARDGAPEAGENARAGVAWLLIDMTLVTGVAAIVKAQGADYAAAQIVFIRAFVGLAASAPYIWRRRRAILAARRFGAHAFRVACGAGALSANYVALAALPLALVTAIGFSRPLVTMALAALFLGEKVGRMRWLAAGASLAAVAWMIAPDGEGWSPDWALGALAALAWVLLGSLSTVQTRALRGEDLAALMLFYTLGLTALSAPVAWALWRPVEAADWPALLAVGLLAQCGQYCFLSAYRLAPASVLAPVGYLSLAWSAAAGYLIFGEIPAWSTLAGVAAIIVMLRLAERAERGAGGRA